MATENDEPEDRREQPDRPTFNVTGLEIVDNGRITIPSRFRDRYDLEEDDVIDLRITTEGVRFWCLDLVVDGSGRIRIPQRKRELYDVEDGDFVDLDVMLTDMTHED